MNQAQTDIIETFGWIILIIMIGFISFGSGNTKGISTGRNETSITHCQNIGYASGYFDNDEDRIVCWDEIVIEK